MYANKLSLVGSIGVVGFMSNFNNIFQNKTKIDRHIFTTSEKLLEHRFDPLKKDFLTEEDQSVLNRYLDHAYGNFKAHVL